MKLENIEAVTELLKSRKDIIDTLNHLEVARHYQAVIEVKISRFKDDESSQYQQRDITALSGQAQEKILNILKEEFEQDLKENTQSLEEM